MSINELPLFSAMNEHPVEPPCGYPKRPLTSQEAHFKIVEKVNACINEVNHFEKRVEYEMKKFMDSCETENNGFKEAIQTSYNAFQQIVRDEVNNFESSMTSSYELFRAEIVNDNNIMQEGLTKLVDEKVAELTRLQETLNEGYSSFKESVNKSIDKYKVDMTSMYNLFTENVESHLAEQDSKINEYKEYMVTNLLVSVETVFNQKVRSGEIAEIMRDIFGSTKTFKGSLSLSEINAISDASNGDYYYCTDNGDYYMWANTWVNIGNGYEFAQEFEAFKDYALENDAYSAIIYSVNNTNKNFTNNFFPDISAQCVANNVGYTVNAGGYCFFIGAISKLPDTLYVAIESDIDVVGVDFKGSNGNITKNPLRKYGDIHAGIIKFSAEDRENYNQIRIKVDNRSNSESTVNVGKFIASNGIYKSESNKIACVTPMSNITPMLEFDTNVKTVKVNSFYAYYDNQRYSHDSGITISYDEDTTSKSKAIVIRNNDIIVITYSKIEPDDIILCYFISDQLENNIGMANIPSASVNGKIVRDSNSPFRVGIIHTAKSEACFSFNTTAETVTISDIYVDYKGVRYDFIEPVTIDYGTNDSSVTKYIVIRNNELKVVTYKEYIESDIVVTVFNALANQMRQIANYAYLNKVMVDGVVYPIPEVSDIEIINKGIATIYVSPYGNDENDGLSVNNPVLTVNKAIELGARNISLAEGEYKTPFNITDKNNINIFVNGNDTLLTSKNRCKAVFMCADRLEVSKNDVSNLIISNYDGLTNPFIKMVFVDKTIEVIDTSSDRSVGYNANLWVTYSNGESDKKLTPVLTLEECETTEDSWTYESGYIYINTNDEGVEAFYVSRLNGSSIVSCIDVTISDVEFKFSNTHNLEIIACNDVNVNDCLFAYSGLGEGLRVLNSNGVFNGCHAYKNRNDGFNIHGNGYTQFIDCCGYYNYDDGISHHDLCEGFINGGEYHHNNKGGVSSPTHGCKANIHNVISHNNGYGIYAVSGDKLSEGTVSGCLVYENDVGIVVQYAKIKAFNNVFKNNTTETQISESGEYIAY